MGLTAWLLAAALAFGGGPDTVPEAEAAFVVVAEQTAPGEVALTIVMPPGVALYREQLGVEPSQEPGFQPSALEVGPGVVEQGPDGQPEVMMRGKVDATVRGTGAGGTLRVRLRGCADAGICYPPMVRVVEIRG